MQSACAVLSSVACLPLPYITHISEKAWFSEKKCHWTWNIFWFSQQLLSEIFLILWRIERILINSVYCSSCKVPVFFCSILIWLEFASQIFEKYSTVKYHEYLPIGSRVVPCRQTDGHDEASNRLSQICDCAREWHTVLTNDIGHTWSS